jgi:5-methylcytosine-specific restriction enzyme A
MVGKLPSRFGNLKLPKAIASHKATAQLGQSKRERVRRAVLSAEPLCRVCDAAGRVSAAVEVDHIRPLWAGGTHARENLQGLCVACHEAKTLRETAERFKNGIT